MTRPLETATREALDKPVLPLAVILYLDIADDPLFAWTGIGDLAFAAAETGDPSLDGKTFKGLGILAEVSQVSEGVGGSDALEISLPGVDPFEPMMRQLITNRNRWQFRRAVVWMMALDPDTDLIAGKPFRIKTGRMDRMPYSESGRGGVAKVRIEGQQAYGNQPLYSRYAEQRDININDISQTWVHALANVSPEMGQRSAGAGGSTGGRGGGSYGGFGGSRFVSQEMNLL